MYCRKKCSPLKATLTSLDHVLVSHQKGNECRGEHWQKRTQWLSSFSAHHPLNISSNLIFCFPCAWCCCTFASATINLLTWEENQTHWSMGCAPWLLPLWQWWWEAENFGCSLPSPLLLLRWWRNCKAELGLFLPRPCYSSAASSALLDAGLLQAWKASKLPGLCFNAQVGPQCYTWN